MWHTGTWAKWAPSFEELRCRAAFSQKGLWGGHLPWPWGGSSSLELGTKAGAFHSALKLACYKWAGWVSKPARKPAWKIVLGKAGIICSPLRKSLCPERTAARRASDQRPRGRRPVAAGLPSSQASAPGLSFTTHTRGSVSAHCFSKDDLETALKSLPFPHCCGRGTAGPVRTACANPRFPSCFLANCLCASHSSRLKHVPAGSRGSRLVICSTGSPGPILVPLSLAPRVLTGGASFHPWTGGPPPPEDVLCRVGAPGSILLSCPFFPNKLSVPKKGSNGKLHKYSKWGKQEVE